MPRVSVLMPCYNAEATLDEALGSLVSQSLDDFEIVAVDDGSTDATPSRLRDWASREPRLRVLTRPHAGLVDSLNAGLQACRSALVARMDTDDHSLPQRLERQADYLQAHPEVEVLGCLVAGFPTESVREGFAVYMGWLNSLVTDEEIRREMFIESPLAHPSVVYRRLCVLEAGGYQEHGWPEDYDLWMRLYLAGRRFAKLPEVLLEWREHPSRLTRTDSRYSLENFLRLKACYLMRGPLAGRESVIIWGAGMMGRRLGRQLIRLQAPLKSFIDIDPRKIGRQRHGLPVVSPDELPALWADSPGPALLAAVGARGARQLIRQRLQGFGLVEGRDWWSAA